MQAHRNPSSCRNDGKDEQYALLRAVPVRDRGDCAKSAIPAAEKVYQTYRFYIGVRRQKAALVRQRDYFFKMTDPRIYNRPTIFPGDLCQKVSRPNNVYPWFGRQANTTIYQLPFPSSTKSA